MDTPKRDLFRIRFWRFAINPNLRRHGHIVTLVCCLSVCSSFVGLGAEEITTALFDPNEAERDAQRKAAWEAEKDLKIGEKKVESRAEEVRRRFNLDLEGPNHRVVEVISSTPNQKGEVVVSTNKIVQLGDGLNYWDGAKWAESQAQFDLNEGYASASKTRHKVNIGGNLNVRGAVAVRMPDNQPFRATVHGLAYYDRATGKSVLLAPIKDSQAYRINSQQILFKDAFEGVNADVRYTISLNRLEQDILLREALPPPEKFQLASATTSLEIWTEIYDAPEPSTYNERNPSGRLDSTGDTDDATHIGFGSMTITPGFSFREGREILPHLRKPVRKSWARIDDRRFLVESLELSDVAEILTEFPAANPSGAFLRPVQDSRQQALLALPRKAISTAMLPVRDAIGDDKLQATLNPKRDGLVLDFTIDLATDTSQGFTFKGTETYHVVAQKSFGPYTNNPPSKVVFEGGTVIKFKKYNSSTNLFPGLDTNCDVDFLGSMYRPIIFTAESDNTVGAAIPNLTETTPNGYYAYTALILRAWNSSRTFNLNWVKFNRAVNPLSFGGGPAHTLRNAQFLNSYYGFATYQTTISIYNGLFSNLDGVFYSDSSTAATIRGEHLTIRNIAEWLAWKVKPTFVNSIVMGVQQYNPYLSIPLYPEWVGYGDLPSGNLINTTPETNNAAAFVTAQQGHHYLPLNSPHRNAGTATINPRLAADLRELTTEAPSRLVGPFNADTTLGPRVFRDIDIPDRGYHYAPLDYYGNAISVNSATLTLKDGIAIACDANYLFTPNSTGKIVSIGRPETLNHLTSYQTVQEGDSTIWTVAGILTLIDGSFVDLSHTDISIPASTKDYRRLFDFDFNGLISLRDCTIRGGYWFVWSTAQTNIPNLSLNNCIFEQCEFNFRQGDVNDTGNFPLTLTIRNCLFTGSIIDLKRSTHDYGNWYIIDNLFDLSSGSLSYYNVSAVGAGIELLGYNGYTTATTFLQDWSSRVNLTRDFAVGPLGDYYYPDATSNTNSLATLVNQGFDGNYWTAATNGLYHHTVQINGTKEGTTRIDIGFHYVATDSRQASAGFSSTQGVNGWSYNYVTSLGNPSSRAALPWNTNGFWGGTADGDTYCQIYSTGMHPGSTYDSMRSFLTPTTGKMAVYGLATDAAPQTPSSTLDGVQARAMYGDEVLVPWQTVAEGASNVPVNGATRMLQGNFVHFQLNKRSANGYDSTTWNPRVLFDSPLDTDGDGLKDYREDKNGNGNVDTGETDWNVSNTPGFGTNSLTVFTPLQ